MKEAPFPTYQSSRLVGVELEYDAGSTRFVEPTLPSGWASKMDGSLNNGREFVMEPPVPFDTAAMTIQTFCDAFDGVKMGLSPRGGYHVHVQVDDYTHTDCYRLVKLYTHFQAVINELLAKSRSDNRYCAVFRDDEVRESYLVEAFGLNRPADSRMQAKSSRHTKVINLAMVRCATPAHRTVEFRQASPSKRFANVYGWCTFVVVLTDIAKAASHFNTAIGMPRTLDGLCQVLSRWESTMGATNLEAWVRWRHEIMNAPVDPVMVTRLVEYLNNSSNRGLYSIAAALDINYPTATRLLEAACQSGQIVRVGTKYRLQRQALEMVMDHLAQLHEAAVQRETVLTVA